MPLSIIKTNAAHALKEDIEKKQREKIVCSVLYVDSDKIHIEDFEPEKLVGPLNKFLAEQQATIYFCDDTSIFIMCDSANHATINGIKRIITQDIFTYYSLSIADDVFHYFDMASHFEQINALCDHKIHMPQKTQKEPVNVEIKPSLTLTHDQVNHLLLQIAARAHRTTPCIMIIDDQAFCRSLILGVLKHINCTCIQAKSAEEALTLYVKHAPDMAMIDVEMPGASGHDLAELIRKNDPTGYLIMVTGNNYSADVMRAKSNNVNGFIVKPFSKGKILECVEKFQKEKGFT